MRGCWTECPYLFIMFYFFLSCKHTGAVTNNNLKSDICDRKWFLVFSVRYIKLTSAATKGALSGTPPAQRALV